MSTQLTLAHIMQQFLPTYKTQYSLNKEQSKAIGSICACRTPALGGQRLACNHCPYQQVQYHSCRNRHCPQCQYRATDQWREKQCAQVLPVPYFHLVFTLPHELNGWVQLHPDVVYRLLFQAAWEILKRFGEDPKRLNGQLGMTSVLHTWGQTLTRHIHLHCLIPGGALSKDGQQWHRARSTYLFPVKALSRCFRGKLVSLLRQAWNKRQLHRIEDVRQVDAILDQLMAKQWVVYSKNTCNHTDTVVGYLSQYTHRIAISNKRILSIGSKEVCFSWKDYADQSKRKVMALEGEEFVRRFLLHILPRGFMRIRHYGFMANCHRRVKLGLIHQCLKASDCEDEAKRKINMAVEHLAMVKQAKQFPCPKCTVGLMMVREEIPRFR